MIRLEPQMRAALTQSLLHHAVETLPAAERDAVRALVGPAGLAAIDALLPISWAPMVLHMRLCDAIRDVVGPERNVAVWRAAMTAACDHPVLRGILRMSSSLLGASPFSLLRPIDRIYTHVTRGLGAARFESVQGSAAGIVALRGFPADRFRFQCYVEGATGSFQSFLQLCRATGEITVIDRDDARGDVRLVVRWAPRP
jgi:hypothetical protein